MSSLLITAPAGAGKTRVLGNSIVNKVKKSMDKIKKNGDHTKKLSVLMTRTPDLTSSLAESIGKQLSSEVGSSGYRIIKWGGTNSEDFQYEDLIKFVEESSVPVVLVTSYPTLGRRINDPQDIEGLFSYTNNFLVDEVHNSGGKVFESFLKGAKKVATRDRESGNIMDSLDILGVTASPITRVQRTIELFDAAYWNKKISGSPTEFKNKILKAKNLWRTLYADTLEWIRISKQYDISNRRGEINAPLEVKYYKAKEHGHKFKDIFKRATKGNHSNVDLDKLEDVWPDLKDMIKDHGPGIINTHARDADGVARTLSELSGKNYVSLQKYSPEKREEIYKAFRDQTLFEGKKVDAIVGRIREGLDFPDAGWFFSFKKHVKFPETIQAQGRINRSNLDKLPPVVVYFGEESERIATANIEDLVLRKLGRRPRNFKNTVSFRGARIPPAGNILGRTVNNLNAVMEAYVRFNVKDADKIVNLNKIDPDVLKSLQDGLKTVRRSKVNLEIAEEINEFVYQINSYPFYKGSLDSTWKYCDEVLKAKKNGEPYPKNSQEVLNNEDMMAMIKEFRSMKSWIGGFPRAIIDKMQLVPLNLYQVASTFNAFVKRNNNFPYHIGEGDYSFAQYSKDAMESSFESFWKRLDYPSRRFVDKKRKEWGDEPFELALENYFKKNKGELPEYSYDKIASIERNFGDDTAHKLKLRLDSYLEDGSLDLNLLGSSILKALDESEFYMHRVQHVHTKFMIEVENLLEKVKAGKLKVPDSSLVTYDNLLSHSEFGILRIVRSLADKDHPYSKVYYDEIEKMLKEVRRAIDG